MKKLLFILAFILLTACSTNKQEQVLENSNQDTISQEQVKNTDTQTNEKYNEYKKENNILLTAGLKKKIFQEIKNVKSAGDFEMMRFDCSIAKQFEEIYKVCLKEKKQAEKRYWEKIKQRNQKIASFQLSDCEKSIGSKYKPMIEQIGKVQARDLLFMLPLSEEIDSEKVENLSKDEIKKLIYKQMKQEINNCKLGYAFQKNKCEELEDEELKQECKTLRNYYNMQIKLDQVKNFDVRNYIN